MQLAYKFSYKWFWAENSKKRNWQKLLRPQHWFKGKLITTTAMVKKSWEEIHESNNIIRKGKKRDRV